MNRILASLSMAGLLAVGATAQCLDVASPGTLIGVGDDTTFTPHYALGFSFPVAGSALGTYTHFRLNPNGWMILTNGTTTPAGTPSGYGSDTVLAGTTAGYAPRIAPFWRDMTVIAPGGVYYDNTTNAGVSTKISWKETREYNALPTKSYTVELFATGAIRFNYSAGMNVIGASPAWVGVSKGNGQAAVAQSDLSTPGGTAGVGMLFQQFATGAFDLTGLGALDITPDGSGGWNWAFSQCASHTASGTGCYGIVRELFHEFFATPALASAALQGNAMTLTPTANGYTAAWVAGGASAYVAPGGGATNVNATASDDTNTVVTPTTALPIPGGSTATLNVSSNGIISVGSTAAIAGLAYVVDLPLFAPSTVAAFYNWHDFNEAEAGSGRIKKEEVVIGLDNNLVLTWDGVESYADPDTTLNPSTVQFQFNLVSGVVTVIWQTVSPDSTETTFPTGIPYLVGYNGPGASSSNNPVTLATSLPLTTAPNISPLTLSASPAPKYTVGNPSVPLTYTINNVIDLAPPFGVGVSFLIFSVGSLPGIDLGPLGIDIGAGGCNLYIPSFDVTISPTGTAPTSTWGPIAIPQPLSPGLTFYAQAFSLFTPNSLPGGLNNAGILSSNLIASRFDLF